MDVVVARTVNPSVLATGASLMGLALMEMVAVFESTVPSLTLKVKESGPL